MFATVSALNRYLTERSSMMQEWADYIDKLVAEAKKKSKKVQAATTMKRAA
jgi:hypothetical protein